VLAVAQDEQQLDDRQAEDDIAAHAPELHGAQGRAAHGLSTRRPAEPRDPTLLALHVEVREAAKVPIREASRVVVLDGVDRLELGAVDDPGAEGQHDLE